MPPIPFDPNELNEQALIAATALHISEPRMNHIQAAIYCHADCLTVDDYQVAVLILSSWQRRALPNTSNELGAHGCFHSRHF